MEVSGQLHTPFFGVELRRIKTLVKSQGGISDVVKYKLGFVLKIQVTWTIGVLRFDS
jgi:hypothetical protein